MRTTRSRPERSAPEPSGTPPRQVHEALRALSVGVPFFEAVRLAGAPSAEVWQEAEARGLIDLAISTALDRKARISAIADARIEERLLDPEANPSLLELNAISGTATDKILKAGQTESDESRISKIVEMLHASGGGTVSLSVDRPDPTEGTIDIHADAASSREGN